MWIVWTIIGIVVVAVLVYAIVLCLAAKNGNKINAEYWARMERYLSDEMKKPSARRDK